MARMVLHVSKRCACSERLALHAMPPHLLLDTALSDMVVDDGVAAGPSGTSVRKRRDFCAQQTALTSSSGPSSS